MRVTLFDYTGYGLENPGRRAANVLIFTKSTRLQMSPSLMKEIEKWEEDKIINELKYMSNTIPGAWEFIDFSFLIEDVTRAFTHQLVRTRNASYQQQTLRVLDVSEGRGWDYMTGPSIETDKMNKKTYEGTMTAIDLAYKFMIARGARVEDARGLLPTNILTNITLKIDMRNWINLIRKRTSLRVQDEFRKVIDLMIIEVEKVYPWIWMFVNNDETKARKDLQDMIYENYKLSSEEKTNMIKKLDIIMKEI